jgi:hypothetical protein
MEPLIFSNDYTELTFICPQCGRDIPPGAGMVIEDAPTPICGGCHISNRDLPVRRLA